MEDRITRGSARKERRPRTLLHQYAQAIAPASAVAVICRACSRALRVPVDEFRAGATVPCPHCGVVTDLKDVAASVPSHLTFEWGHSRDRPVSEFP